MKNEWKQYQLAVELPSQMTAEQVKTIELAVEQVLKAAGGQLVDWIAL